MKEWKPAYIREKKRRKLHIQEEKGKELA